MKRFFLILKNAFKEWSDDHAMTFSAALSYYMLFSIAPLLLIAIAAAGLFLGQEATRGEMFSTIRDLLGAQGAQAIESFVKASSVKSQGVIATIIGVVTLFIGATTVFSQLQDALNQIWHVNPSAHGGFGQMIKSRLLSFAMILIIALILLVSLLLSAILSAINEMAIVHLPGGEILWQGINIGTSFAVAAFLFAAIFKVLPQVKLTWKEVWVGGVITAIFFSIGKTLIGLYLGRQGVTSTYGAAGSVVLILLWTYYSSAILFFGAEYTKVRKQMMDQRHNQMGHPAPSPA